MNQKGFTLVKSIVVAIIVLILASIGFFSYQRYVEKRRRQDPIEVDGTTADEY